MKVRKSLIVNSYNDAKIVLFELHPKITKRKLEELRAKIKGIADSDILKMVVEHITSSNLRHHIVYKSVKSDSNQCPLFNFSTKKEKILKQLKAIAGIKG